jgi:hypothetical protein
LTKERKSGEYNEKSLKELNSGNILQVVSRELIIRTVFRELFVKLLNLLKQKGTLTQAEIEGIVSEVTDTRVYEGDGLEALRKARLKIIDAEIEWLEAQLKDGEKQDGGEA